MTAGQLASRALMSPILAEALEDVRGPRGDINTRLLGWKLKHVRGRPSGGIRIMSRRGRTNQTVWYAEVTDTALGGRA